MISYTILSYHMVSVISNIHTFIGIYTNIQYNKTYHSSQGIIKFKNDDFLKKKFN